MRLVLRIFLLPNRFVELKEKRSWESVDALIKAIGRSVTDVVFSPIDRVSPLEPRLSILDNVWLSGSSAFSTLRQPCAA